ncbi:MAG: cytochrome c biogenesis protein CcsA [Saprospiraceae bacterium]|nr:cytochrome c biogenesis protein CcsA [Saprospiraceae bacterium]
MNDIQYIGENLLPRQIGHFSVVLAFISALLATISYFFATQKQIRTDDTEGVASWQRLGRWSFGVHSVAILTLIGSIFYVMINKRFEYFYAHSHVDTDLPFQYNFAAFWEGQEGSFLLWMFWHVGLGAFIILRGMKDWENPVISTLACVQVFLSSMILGLHFGWGEHIIKWGSNPILLLRETMNAPIFQQADYVTKLAKTAKGLNPLLQNYWMTIHPPVLFLGFASTSIPFCFAIAGLWTKKYTEWLRPALPYSLFSGAVLGTGILMGGAWAYEALSFNGYWAWDPVENMSLVPWLVMVAGLHTHLIARATGHSLRATFMFYILSFLLVLYSTFLTRSGILGDTSAHAFTEMGLEWQLVLLQMFFLVGGLFLFFKNYKSIPNPAKEETVTSREFWLFIGSLVLILSVVLISFTTSLPVFNKIITFFNPSAKKLSAPVDTIGHYNKTQLWIGVFMGFLSAIAQFLRYKEFNFENYRSTLLKHLGISAGLSVGITLLLLGWINAASAWQYVLLLFAGVFTLIANADYLVSFMRKNLSAAGSAFSHMGFGVLVVGILASGVNKTWISKNRFAMEGLINFSEDQFGKNILLMKGSAIPTETGWEMLYESDTTYGTRRDFTLKLRKKSKDLKSVVDSFTVHPYVLYDKKSGKIASTNPDTRHFLTYDVFSHIAALPPTEQDPEIAHEVEDSLKYRPFDIPLGTPTAIKPDLAKTPQYSVVVEGINSSPTHPKYKAEEKDIAVGVKLKILRGADSVYTAEPIVLIREDNVFQLPVTVNQLGLRIRAESEIFDRLFVPQKDLAYKDYIFQQGQTLSVGNTEVTFEGVNASPKVENFQLEPSDLAFAANLKVVKKDKMGDSFYATSPVYVIRGTTPIPIKDDVPELGMHFAIAKVKPETKQITIKIAQGKPTQIPISIAEDAPRTDYIVLEATVNPGINLVWLGSILMMLGLSVAMFYRLRK